MKEKLSAGRKPINSFWNRQIDRGRTWTVEKVQLDSQGPDPTPLSPPFSLTRWNQWTLRRELGSPY